MSSYHRIAAAWKEPLRREVALKIIKLGMDTRQVVARFEAELVKLCDFVGMTSDEAAPAPGISPRTAKYYWTHARAWLYREIDAPES